MNYQDYEILKRKIDLLSTSPGCYLMKNESGTIIYVGKAKSLIKRVKQYFTRPQSGKVFRMVQEIRDFDTIETDTEKEALLLEINLIQKYYPKYNILLKDGKMYPFIALSKGKDPVLKITHSNKDKRFTYFGPYPVGGAAYQMLKLLNQIYPLRKCNSIPSKPCLYYYLGECLGPCINKVDEKDYKDILSSMIKFLNGDTKEVVNDITLKMKKDSDELNFEAAQRYKETLDSIAHISSQQKIMMADHIDRDVVGYSLRDGYMSVLILMYRKGTLLGKELFINEATETIDEDLASILLQFYSTHVKPKELLITDKQMCPLLQDALGIKVLVPSRGVKKDILFMAFENAKKGLDEHFQTARLEDNTLLLLEELGNLLNISAPLDIELYDNSHLQGEEAIGAMVKYINGVKSPSMYRRYNIRSENKKDDLQMMYEVLDRRISRLLNDHLKMPDLIIVDGGENQINVANQIKEKYQVNIKIAGLFKNDKHETEGLIDGDTLEIKPLDSKAPLFFLLMRMQDEVHRYAITTHRNKRQKALFTDIFEEVPGIGKKRASLLLSAYPSFDSLQKATKEELRQFLPEEAADNLIKAIKEKQKNISSIH